MEKKLYTVQELAERWCLSEKTIRRYIHQGQIPGVIRTTMSGQYRIPAKSVRLKEMEMSCYAG